MTTEFRWLVERYPARTEEYVRNLSKKYGLSLSDGEILATVEAINTKPRSDRRVLQTRTSVFIDGVETFWGVEWVDVPTIVEVQE